MDHKYRVNSVIIIQPLHRICVVCERVCNAHLEFTQTHTHITDGLCVCVLAIEARLNRLNRIHQIIMIHLMETTVAN